MPISGGPAGLACCLDLPQEGKSLGPTPVSWPSCVLVWLPTRPILAVLLNPENCVLVMLSAVLFLFLDPRKPVRADDQPGQ